MLEHISQLLESRSDMTAEASVLAASSKRGSLDSARPIALSNDELRHVAGGPELGNEPPPDQP